MFRIVLLALLLPLSNGCAFYFMYQAHEFNASIDSAVNEYHTRARLVHLGDPREKVLAVLPSQEGIPPQAKRSADAFTARNGDGQSNLVEIYYFRSARIPDGVTTDDEFTPYTFHDGVLTAIGWTALGGPKTAGKSQAADSIPISL